MILWAGFSSLMMDNGEPMAARFAIRRFQDAIERSEGAVLTASLHRKRLARDSFGEGEQWLRGVFD